MAGCHLLGDVHEVSFVDGGCTEAAECGQIGECQLPLCAEGQCAFTNVAQRTPCTEGFCDGLGNCVQCADQNDCEAGPCQNGLCVVQTCINGALDGNETDVDCGGPCAPCGQGEGCAGSQDCASGVCTGSVCQPCTGELCASGGFCDPMTAECLPRKPLGADCEEDYECASDKCDETTQQCTFSD